MNVDFEAPVGYKGLFPSPFSWIKLIFRARASPASGRDPWVFWNAGYSKETRRLLRKTNEFPLVSGQRRPNRWQEKGNKGRQGELFHDLGILLMICARKRSIWTKSTNGAFRITTGTGELFITFTLNQRKKPKKKLAQSLAHFLALDKLLGTPFLGFKAVYSILFRTKKSKRNTASWNSCCSTNRLVWIRKKLQLKTFKKTFENTLCHSFF